MFRQIPPRKFGFKEHDARFFRGFSDMIHLVGQIHLQVNIRQLVN